MTSHVTEHNEHVALLFKPSEDTFNTNLHQLFLFYQDFTFLRKWNYNPFAQNPAFTICQQNHYRTVWPSGL